MKNENGKKGFFERLFGSKKAKKSPCCCQLEIEEVPEENGDNPNKNENTNGNGNSCCQ